MDWGRGGNFLMALTMLFSCNYIARWKEKGESNHYVPPILGRVEKSSNTNSTRKLIKKLKHTHFYHGLCWSVHQANVVDWKNEWKGFVFQFHRWILKLGCSRYHRVKDVSSTMTIAETFQDYRRS